VVNPGFDHAANVRQLMLRRNMFRHPIACDRLSQQIRSRAVLHGASHWA
jgi:hypothetical protein